MTQKIKPLYNKALESYTYSDIDGDNNKGTQLNVNKFAELIIQECISVIEPDDHPVDEINYRYAIISDIKKHFGIE